MISFLVLHWFINNIIHILLYYYYVFILKKTLFDKIRRSKHTNIFSILFLLLIIIVEMSRFKNNVCKTQKLGCIMTYYECITVLNNHLIWQQNANTKQALCSFVNKTELIHCESLLRMIPPGFTNSSMLNGLTSILFIHNNKKKQSGTLKPNRWTSSREPEISVTGKSARDCFLYDLDHWAYKMSHLSGPWKAEILFRETVMNSISGDLAKRGRHLCRDSHTGCNEFSFGNEFSPALNPAGLWRVILRFIIDYK